jgi:hypothetical protein
MIEVKVTRLKRWQLHYCVRSRMCSVHSRDGCDAALVIGSGGVFIEITRPAQHLLRGSIARRAHPADRD